MTSSLVGPTSSHVTSTCRASSSPPSAPLPSLSPIPSGGTSPKTTTQKTQSPSFFFKTSRTPQSTPGGRLRTYFVTLREEVPNGSLTERTCFSTSTLGASFSTHSSSWNEFT
ncbi:hypothetical protein AAZV13_12G119332 [Glycine max]